MKKILLCLIVATIIYSCYSTTNQCKSIQCKILEEENKCVKPIDESTFYLQSCSKENTFCPIDSEYPSEEMDCVDKSEIAYTKFPGMRCSKDNECLSRKCVDSLCYGLAQGEECVDSEDCVYELTCISGKCQLPLKENEQCSKDTDCDLNHGCLNGVCTEYFSKENGEIVTMTKGIFSFCKSGYANKDGICKSLTLDDPKRECSDTSPCDYTDENQNRIILNENCLCGYNRNSSRYCLLGSGEKNYTKYIEKIKSYYNNNQNCHLSERYSLGCLKDKIEGDATIKKSVQQLINKGIWALSNYKMYSTDKCALSIMLPSYDPSQDEPEPIPEKAQCAKYDYKDEQKYCVSSTYYSKSKINVLLSDICEKDQYCNIGGKPNEVFYKNENITGKCEVKTDKKIERYPGEKCESNSDCKQITNDAVFGTCKSNKCTGISKGDKCTSTSQCLAGYYCDSTEQKCKSQLGKNDKCTSSYECENKYLCYEGKCQDVAFSIETGKKINITTIDQVLANYYCEYGLADGNTCVQLISKKYSDDKYKECEFGTECEYLTYPTETTITKPCECGYNSAGKAYCPKVNDKDQSSWIKYYKLIKKQFDNECHSMNRFNCYEYDKGLYDEILVKRNELVNGHLFYNSVTKAEKILSGNYIQKSFISSILAVIVFFL